MNHIQIPKGWTEKKLGEISEVKRGLSWQKNSESKSKINDSIPVLRIGNIRERYLDLDDILYIHNITDQQKNDNKVSKNDILVVGSNGNRELVGRSCKIDRDMDFVYASFLMGIRKISEEIDPDFLLYFLNSPQGWDFIRNSTTTGVGINNLKISSLRDMSIIFPTRIQQKKIVQKLNYVLGQIEETIQVISELQKMILKSISGLADKQMLRQSKRSGLISYYVNEVVLDLISNCAESSVKKFITVEDCCSEIIDTPHSTVIYSDDGIPVIRTTNLQPNTIDFEQTKFTTNEIYEQRRRKIDPQIGDVLYTREAPWGIAAPVTRNKFVVGQRIVLLRTNKQKIHSDFLSLVLNSKFGYEQALKVVNRTTSEHVNIHDIRQFLIPDLPLDVQQMVLTEVKQKIRRLELIESMLTPLLEEKNKMYESIESIPKSILYLAFSGKLVN